MHSSSDDQPDIKPKNNPVCSDDSPQVAAVQGSKGQSETIESIEIVEVSPRDGFQSIPVFIETANKATISRYLLDCGVKRLEIGAVVSPRAVPQMADTPELLASVANYASEYYPEARLSVLIATASGGLRALKQGAQELVFVVSVSESHNQANVRRSVAESLTELEQLFAGAQQPFALRLNLATSFDCPFEGTVADAQVAAVLERALCLADQYHVNCELGLCDTTGKALPQHVKRLCSNTLSTLSNTSHSLAFHGHDTFGFGVANALFSIEAGVRVLDASVAGLGGCPFAPGASGNTATEDLVYTLEKSGLSTGIELAGLLLAADLAAEVEGGVTGGHIRNLPRERLLNDQLQSAQPTEASS